MKNWKEVYESYKNGEMKEKYEELKRRLGEKHLTAEEYKEYSKMTKVMNNLPKVENLIDFQDKLDRNLEILKEEIATRENQDRASSVVETLNKEIDENMNKQNEILSKRKELNKKLMEKDITEEERKAITDQLEGLDVNLKKLREEAQNNNKYFTKGLSIKEEIKGREELAKLSSDELREHCFKTAAMISKSNLLCGRLMEGYNRDNLELTLKNWKDRKFTSKTPLPLTRKERRKEELDNSIKKSENIKADNVVEQVINDDIIKKDLEDYNFEKAYPRLSKITPKFIQNSRFGKRLVERKKKKLLEKIQKDQVEENVEEVVEEVVEENVEENKREKFVNYLKYDILEVADKGVDGIEEEKANNQKLKEEEIEKSIEEEVKKRIEELKEKYPDKDFDKLYDKLYDKLLEEKNASKKIDNNNKEEIK